MSYLDEFGLSVYDSNLKEWISSQESKTITSSIYPWTKTVKAGIVSCYPVGGTELKPVVDFLFTETPPANGDKSPSNPSTITGVSTIKVGAGNKNLFYAPYNSDMHGLTSTFNSDGSIVFNGTATQTCIITAKLFSNNAFRSNKVTISANNANTSSGVIMRWGTGSGWLYLSSANAKKTYNSFPATTAYSSTFQIRVESGTQLDNFIIWPQVEIGSIATNFEKPIQAQYDISLDSTYYGGSINLATGLMTVTHVKETITSVAGGGVFDSVVVFNAWPSAVIVSGENATVCEELPYAAGNVESEHWRNLTSASGTVGCYVYLLKSRLNVSGAVDPSNPTVAEWRAAANAYLATNPLHFVFTLATPYTVQLTSTEILSLTQTDKYTPRLNTIYTDASFIQVGYVKSPIREEYELQQAIVSQGGSI